MKAIEPNERVFICGKTRSGKTYLARHLAANLRRLFVLDPKGTLTDWNTEEVSDYALRRMQNGGDGRLRFTAPVYGAQEYWIDAFLKGIGIQDLVIYCDEMYLLSNTGRPDESFRAVWAQGREWGIGAWATVQRPTWMPLFTLTEAEHFFVFRLTMQSDRERMAEFMGPEVLEPIKDPHGFFYYSIYSEGPVYFKEMPTGGVKALNDNLSHNQASV